MDAGSSARFEKLSTHKLESILRKSLKDRSSSPEDLLLISEILKRRDAGKGIGPPNAEEAWGRFLERQKGDSSGSPPEASPKHKPFQNRFLQQCAILAVCAFSAASVILTAQAFGYDLVGAIVHWTAGTFHFEAAGTDEGGNEGSRLGDNPLMDGEMPAEFIPSWLPDGFKKADTKYISTAGFNSLYVEYSDKERLLTFNLSKYDSTKTSRGELFEKQNLNVERYFCKDKEFIFSRNGESDFWTAAWSDGTLVFRIQGDVTKADLIKIIDFLGGTS